MTRGLYKKFRVYRADGQSKKGKKHHDCEYFVLDLDHDPHAKAAVVAYAKACRAQFPELCADLMTGVAHGKWAFTKAKESHANRECIG